MIDAKEKTRIGEVFVIKIHIEFHRPDIHIHSIARIIQAQILVQRLYIMRQKPFRVP